jgi:hypothetical protein
MSTPKRTAAPLKTPEGKAFYQAILERNTRSARKSHRITQAFGALCLIALPISLHYFGPALWTYFLPFGIFMGVISRVEPRTSLTENEYRHLQNTLGQPNHCVHCGNTRFERHYYGRSNYEVLKCEGCHNTVYRT